MHATFIAFLWGSLALSMSSMVGRVLLALGISFVSYTGLSTVTTYTLSQLTGTFAGMPSSTLNLLAWLWVDKAITVVFSAYTSALALQLGTSAVVRRMVQR